KSWRLLRRARCSTRRIGTAVQAIHTLLTCDYSG
ncbi:IS5/IS1182 family transposase, partial [Streptomyces sp. NPDC048419]